jgi:predicted nucleotidyltransferase
MREVKKIVGLTKGAVKSLRKSYASNATKILGGEHLAKFVTHHKTEQVLGRHYNKANRANVKHMTNQVAEVYQFKKK